jgi:PIN domain nuclease of toxin-antitoxin system
LRFLLDTHALLWWLSDDRALPAGSRKLIARGSNAVVVSAASGWEIATKVRLGKLPMALDLVADLERVLDQEGFETLAISLDHSVRAGLLPGPHKDPFDRMLIAQSQAEGVPILSNDTAFDGYGVRRFW